MKKKNAKNIIYSIFSVLSAFAILLLCITYLVSSYNLYQVVEKHRLKTEIYTGSTYTADHIFDKLPSLKLDHGKLMLKIDTNEKSISYPNFFIRAKISYKKEIKPSLMWILNEYGVLLDKHVAHEAMIESEYFEVFFNHSSIKSINLKYEELYLEKDEVLSSLVNLVSDSTSIKVELDDYNSVKNNGDVLNEIIQALDKVQNRSQANIKCEVKQEVRCTIN